MATMNKKRNSDSLESIKPSSKRSATCTKGLRHELSRERYDVFLSFDGNETLYTDCDDKRWTMRELVEQIAHKGLQDEWRSKRRHGTLSIYYDEKALSERPHTHDAAIEETLYGLLQTRGGGLFVALITQNYFNRDECLAELECALHLINRDGKKEGKLRICLIPVDMDVDDIKRATRSYYEKLRDMLSAKVKLSPSACDDSPCTVQIRLDDALRQISKLIVQCMKLTVPGKTIEDSRAYLKRKIVEVVAPCHHDPVEMCMPYIKKYKAKWTAGWCSNKERWEEIMDDLQSIHKSISKNPMKWPIDHLPAEITDSIDKNVLYDVVILSSESKVQAHTSTMIHMLMEVGLKSTYAGLNSPRQFRKKILRFCRHVVLIHCPNVMSELEDVVKYVCKRRKKLQKQCSEWNSMQIVLCDAIELPHSLGVLNVPTMESGNETWWDVCEKLRRRLVDEDNRTAIRSWEKYLEKQVKSKALLASRKSNLKEGQDPKQNPDNDP